MTFGQSIVFSTKFGFKKVIHNDREPLVLSHPSARIDIMFDTAQGSFDEILVERRPSVAADELIAAALAAARRENSAAAARLTAIGELYALRWAERDPVSELWGADPQCAVIAEVSAALNLDYPRAAAQVGLARALRERLPKVLEVFRAGELSEGVVDTLVGRTQFIVDPAILAGIDARLARAAAQLMTLSYGQLCGHVDRMVGKKDPDARRRRRRVTAEDRDVWVDDGLDGMSSVRGAMPTADAHVFERRRDALADTVCAADPRTRKQRRVDAIRAASLGADRLQCLCGQPDCPNREAIAAPFVIHVVTGPDGDEAGEGDEVDVDQPDGEDDEADADADADVEAEPTVSLIQNGGVLLPDDAAWITATAKRRPLVHPGDAPPELRYTPSRNLADFVRCRDLGCRFPGCDVPAAKCDLDHTIPYSAGGSTQASNLKALCRIHHLIKTFWGWSDQQCCDGTVIWHSPAGQRYVTRPGSAQLFPSLCTPTGPIVRRDVTQTRTGDRAAMMPTRSRTRAQDRAARIEAERQANRDARQARRSARQRAWDELTNRPPGPDDEPPPF